MNETIQLLERQNDFVINDRLNKQYSIVLGGTTFSTNRTNCIIPVTSRREIELLFLCLGEEANVLIDDRGRELFPEIANWLYGRTYSDIFAALKWSCHEEDEVIDLIERIPLPPQLRDSFLKINNDDPEPERISPEYVHKNNKDNVLISIPYRCGNMFYFNGFTNSAEFDIDHSSDHLEGIIIFEITRQAGIASIHLAGIPLSGTIVILKTIIRYTKFIESTAPLLIRVIPVIKQNGGYGYGVYNIIQNGYFCVTGYITGLVYKTKNAYQKFRNLKIIDRAATEKMAKNFPAKEVFEYGNHLFKK